MNQIIQNGHHRQEADLIQALERLLSDARKGKLRGAVFACKYSGWHHGVWVVGDYVTKPDDALSASEKLVDALAEYCDRASPSAASSAGTEARSVGMLYRLIVQADGAASMPFCTDAVRRIFRLTPEEVREDATRIGRVILPDDIVDVVARVNRARETGGFCEMEYRTLFPDGTGASLIAKADVTLLPGGASQWDGVIVEQNEP